MECETPNSQVGEWCVFVVNWQKKVSITSKESDRTTVFWTLNVTVNGQEVHQTAASSKSMQIQGEYVPDTTVSLSFLCHATWYEADYFLSDYQGNRRQKKGSLSQLLHQYLIRINFSMVNTLTTVFCQKVWQKSAGTSGQLLGLNTVSMDEKVVLMLRLQTVTVLMSSRDAKTGHKSANNNKATKGKSSSVPVTAVCYNHNQLSFAARFYPLLL